jgi:hypothetical protein
MVVPEEALMNMERLKMVSGDLLDIWLYEGNKALEYAKQTKFVSTVYEKTDPYVNYVAKFEQIKEKGTLVAGQIQQYGESAQEKVVSTSSVVMEKVEQTRQFTEDQLA